MGSIFGDSRTLFTDTLHGHRDVMDFDLGAGPAVVNKHIRITNTYIHTHIVHTTTHERKVDEALVAQERERLTLRYIYKSHIHVYPASSETLSFHRKSLSRFSFCTLHARSLDSFYSVETRETAPLHSGHSGTTARLGCSPLKSHLLTHRWWNTCLQSGSSTTRLSPMQPHVSA